MSARRKFLIVTASGALPTYGIAPAAAEWARLAGYEVEVSAHDSVPEKPVPMLCWYDEAAEIPDGYWAGVKAKGDAP